MSWPCTRPSCVINHEDKRKAGRCSRNYDEVFGKSNDDFCKRDYSTGESFNGDQQEIPLDSESSSSDDSDLEESLRALNFFPAEDAPEDAQSDSDTSAELYYDSEEESDDDDDNVLIQQEGFEEHDVGDEGDVTMSTIYLYLLCTIIYIFIYNIQNILANINLLAYVINM